MLPFLAVRVESALEQIFPAIYTYFCASPDVTERQQESIYINLTCAAFQKFSLPLILQ